MWNPEDYAQHSAAQLQWAQELRSHLQLQGSEAILDVGCGDGKITADFAAHLPHGRVMGVDFSAPMIDYARSAYPPATYPNLSFAQMDARSLSFEAEFDLLFSNAVLHWVDDHPAFLQGAYRALRPGGRLILSCGGEGNAEGILQAVTQVVSQSSWQSYFDKFENPYFFHGLTIYREWLTAAGWQIHRLELVPKDMRHPGAAGLADWLRTTWMPITHRVPVTERERLIQDCVQTYLIHHPLDDQGWVHVDMVRLEVDAQKTNP